MIPFCKWQARALFVVCLVAAGASAQTFTTLSSLSDKFGAYPVGPLVQGIDGNLYGAGFYGGYKQDGTVFRITPEGALSLVHYFHFANDGSAPTGLVLETNGNLYGTTLAGGANPCGSGEGCGTVFGFTSAGTLFTLDNFSASGPAGSNPEGGLTLGPDGSTFYGTTSEGWVASNEFGTVFKITPTGTLTVLHAFDNTDGAYPAGALVVGTNGNLYGTTSTGGSDGAGTVFEITPEGTLTTLHAFNETDGSDPNGGLVQAADGNFYGTTYEGGRYGEGTVFVISPGGRVFQTLYDFTGGSDGGTPTALVLGADGNLYGATSGDGQGDSYGTLFEITPAGVLTTLHTFDGTDGGNLPTLMQHTNGTFYGTTREFGANKNCPPANGCGTVFSLSTGLGPFITAVPPRRGIGARVLILGQGLTGATSVTFNGVSASFTVNSDTEITTFVPAGATHGNIQVTTPTGTLSTKVIFVVG
jgi:uncharacterized repeat protein (TIGR03803 family)